MGSRPGCVLACAFRLDAALSKLNDHASVEFARRMRKSLLLHGGMTTLMTFPLERLPEET